MQTLYACKDFSAYLVDSKYTGHEASTSLAGANTLARDSSHASTRSRTRRWHRGGLPGELQNQACLSAVQRRPIHRPLLGLVGSGSAYLAGSCSQSWNGINGVPAYTTFLYI
jgi:hypothetical protein